MIRQYTQKEWLYIFILAGVQFSHILDFVIMMPLGPQLMRFFNIEVADFSQLVSIYTFAAALSCFLASFFMDAFDRKKILCVIYGGLVIGTFLCGVAPNFTLLLVARAVTGVFGGLLQAVILSVLADLIAEGKRGQATGFVFSAFAISSVVGVPLGLYLANIWGWQGPFILLGILSLLNLCLAVKYIPSLTGHLAVHYKPRIIAHFYQLLHRPETYLAAFLTMAMMTTFAMFPFISPFLVGPVGLKESQLPEIYLAGGVASLFAAPILGRLSDRYGAKHIFVFSTLLSIGGVVAFTHIPKGSYTLVIVLNTYVAALGSGRMAPYMELLNRSVPGAQRGSFMTLIAAVQQLSASVASYGGGLILGTNAGFANFAVIGWMVAVSMVVSIGLAYLFKTPQLSSKEALVTP